MIIGKEALVNIEHLAKAQYQVYPDSADIGLELTDNMLDALRADVKTLKGIYKGTNYSPAPDYNGVKNIVIPIEEQFEGVWRCLVVKVLVSQQFKTIAYIDIDTDYVDSFNIPFFTKDTLLA